MLQLFKKPGKPAMGIDIGHQNTKIIVLSQPTPGKLKILKAVMKPTPMDSFKNGTILNAEKLADFLSRTVADMELSQEVNAVAGISGAKGLITKKIDIPKVEANQIPEHLPFEVEQYLPYDMNELDLDYEILKKTKARAENTIPIFVVAVLVNIVKEYDNLCAKAFLNCDTIDANVFALSNIFEWNYGVNEKDCFLLMDIGEYHTNIAVINRGELIFTRSVPAGGKSYTEKIKNNLQMEDQEAEDLKINKKGQPEAVGQALTEVHSLFCDELYAGYESFKTFFPESSPSSAFITGGASQTEGLITALEKKLSLSMKPIDTLKNIEKPSNISISNDILSLYFNPALGLALRVL